MQLIRNKHIYYFLGFVFLFIIEVLIANFVTDSFVRPYLGDFLVVILIYCFLMSISKISVVNGLLIVLLFSFAVEFFQLINIVKLLQYQPPRIVMIVLGSSFSVWDLMAYTLGILFSGIIEYAKNRQFSKAFCRDL
ncbi:DUF2809 domain-containing protein [Christiangramia forsetii]|uniref:DUF2809 domain-containing protein n=1 Tax=Christiangramia forsetii (strain DSM 17595 / CGMCC 1.15422 / KT0803) TaxID=411154 RepID=A0M4H3_CHRFK|nr:DUF2809 domain-containing protein [Christiangramia forsetii]CAL67518.1 conserved hypothetical protein, membrane [Christiangramia forsetii KT0803]